MRDIRVLLFGFVVVTVSMYSMYLCRSSGVVYLMASVPLQETLSAPTTNTVTEQR